MIPKVNVDEVANGIIGVFAAMQMAVANLGEGTTAYFLDLVPERGEKLWDRFRNFQREKKDTSFLDFVQDVVTSDPIKLFYPKECTLDIMTRQLLSGEVQKEIFSRGIKSNTDILQIYFGEGDIYNTARQVSCKGCPQLRCQHNLGSRFKGR